jgi:hypothetical protein
MLSGYQRTSGLQGLDCGAAGCGSCDRGGLGALLDPTTWGPTDWLVMAGAAFVAWKVYGRQKQQRYTRRVVRRLTGE